jgi:hypothetical protein
MWAQLSVGWSWASPSAPATRLALTVMSCAVLGLCVIFLLAVGVMLRPLAVSVRATPVRQLVPMAVLAACIAGLWIGCARVANRWPGASGQRSHHHGAVPVQLARPAWAATLWLSAYWTHPGALMARPDGHFAWMIVSAALLAVAVIAGSLVMRRATPSPRSLRALTALGVTGVGLATVFVAGAATWILGSGPGPQQIFQPGAVDEVGLVLLAAALAAAAHVTRRSLVVARRSPTA